MPGRTGRRPLSRALQVLRGETRPSRLRKPGPEPTAGRPRRPAYLAGYARAEWDRLARLLVPLRVLTVADGPILEATAAAYAHWRDADDVIRTAGAFQTVLTKVGAPMVRQHPAVAVRAEAWRRYVLGLGHFGLSPATRTRVTAAQPAANDPFDEFDAPRGRLARFVARRA